MPTTGAAAAPGASLVGPIQGAGDHGDGPPARPDVAAGIHAEFDDRVVAEQGDVRSAEMLTMMYRQGSRLYGNGFPADMQQAIYWARKAAASRTSVRLAGNH